MSDYSQHPTEYAFVVDFNCEQCGETQKMEGSVDDLLVNVQYSGWPICPECGKDMTLMRIK